MFQSGILGDETGTIRFVTWNNEGAERLTVGTVYTIFYAASDEYNNRLSLTLNGSTCLADDTATINVSALPERRASEFITLEGQVTVIFPPRSASIAQSGVLAHKSGTIRFTIWANLNAPTLETGKWYRFENALTDEYNSQQNLKINAGTKIIPISEELIPDCSHTPIGEIKPGIICTEGKIISLQSITTGTLKAAGVLADETGAIRFTIRLDEIASEIIQGSWYRFSAAIADFYRGSINLQFNTGTKIELLPDKPEMHPQITNVGELKNGIVSLRVKVVQEWEGSGDRMLQSGIVGDETGTVRFVTWKDDTATKLLPGKIYYLHYASVDEFNGKHNLNLNGALIIPDESGIIDVKRTGDEITGALVHISPGSGLIKRCPIEGCGRALTRQNYCQVHEIQPKFQYDLRIKGWLDNGRQTWDTIISREGVENLIGLTLEGAQEMAENNPLGLETVYYHMCEKLLGRYLKCQGRVIDNRLFSTTCEYLTFDPTRHADLINRTEVINHE
jgi:replication factor A1